MHETYDADILRLVDPSKVSAAIHPRLGIVGGGQLAKMTALAGLNLGCEVVVLERNEHTPAANLATRVILGDWDNPEDLIRLASQVDVVTLENEFVDARALRALEESGHALYPTAGTIARIQDKLLQKQALTEAGLPTLLFRAVDSPDEVARAAEELGYPLLLKARRNAYDGRGNVTLRSKDGIASAWQKLGGKQGSGLYVEAFCPFAKELAVIITRGRDGEMATYPLVETVQRDHICHLVRAPAEVPGPIADRALEVARRAVVAVGAVGSFGVELFLSEAGEIFINELAPRVHNSGHYTIEACACSQFENHVRAVLGWPLGDPRMRVAAAAMVNVLGKHKAIGRPIGLERALAVPGAHVHIYGKAMSGPGRKMGHVTALAGTQEEATANAQWAAALIRFGDKT